MEHHCVVHHVTPEWLNDQKGDVKILDVQPNIHDYLQEHVPEAVFCNEGLFRVPKLGRPGAYVDEAVIASLFGRLGLMRDTPVAVYTAKGVFSSIGDGLGQTMAAYTLARFGVKDVYVLDGGLDVWKEQGYETTQAFPYVEETSYSPVVRSDLFLTYETFVDIKDNDGVVVLDARPPHFYEGRGPWIKPGHIPGAINLPWKSLMHETNPARRKDISWIRSLLEDRGITPDKRIICSCGTGREATNEFVLFKWVLAYPDVQIYEGSFTEWSSYPENPTVTGPEPR